MKKLLYVFFVYLSFNFINSQESDTYTGISSSDGVFSLEIPESMDALNGYPSANSLDSNAITYYNKGVKIIFDDVNKAVDYFIMAINYDSKFVQAYDNLGKAYRMLKKYDLAIKSYELSLKIFPNGTSAHQNLAIVYNELGDFSKAIDKYNIVIKMLPLDPEGYYGLANTYLGVSEFNKALPIALKALKLYEKNPPNYIGDSYAQITLIYYYLGKLSMAKKYMEISKEKFILNDFESNFYDTFPQKIINEIYNADDIQSLSSIELLKIKGYKNIIESMFILRNKSQGEMSKLGTTQEDYERYDKLKPEFDDLTNEIIDYLNKIIVLDQSNIYAIDKLKLLDLNLYVSQTALKTFDEYYADGIIKQDSGDYDGALIEYSRAIELNPNFVASYINRGLVKQSLKDYAGAMIDYNKAIEIKPDSYSYMNRAILKHELKEFEFAIKDFDLAMISDNKESSIKDKIYYNKGNSLASLEDYYGAISSYKKAIDINSNYAFAYFQMGVCKYYISDISGGCTDFKKAKELGFNDADRVIKEYCN